MSVTQEGSNLRDGRRLHCLHPHARAQCTSRSTVGFIVRAFGKLVAGMRTSCLDAAFDLRVV